MEKLVEILFVKVKIYKSQIQNLVENKKYTRDDLECIGRQREHPTFHHASDNYQ